MHSYSNSYNNRLGLAGLIIIRSRDGRFRGPARHTSMIVGRLGYIMIYVVLIGVHMVCDVRGG